VRGKIDAVCSRVDMHHLLSHYGVKRSKKNHYDTPFGCSVSQQCLHVSNCGQLWYDFNSKRGGKIFTYVKMKENCDFKQALEILEKIR
jgi:hypothetical protein